MPRPTLGIDVGGTRIKAGLVDLETGQLVSEHVHVPTPVGATPDAILEAVAGLVDMLSPDDPNSPVGICFPAVVRHGVTLTAANVSDQWIGLDASAHFTAALGRDTVFMNDADAAGYAEAQHGAAKNAAGLVLMVTLGTGIGTAMIHDGVLIPNSELGHIEIDGIDWETMTSVSAKERDGLSWVAWSDRLQTYLSTLERLINPDLFVIGGGVSSTPEKFLPLLDCRTQIVAATLHNQAGTSGAASLASLSHENRRLR